MYLNSKPNKPQVLSVFVSKINYEAKEDDVRSHFLKIGKVKIKSLRLVYDRDRTFKGTAFIDFHDGDKESYDACIKEGDGSDLMGRKIIVKATMDKEGLKKVVSMWAKKEDNIISKKKSTNDDKKKKKVPTKKKERAKRAAIVIVSKNVTSFV